jgi:Na+/H+-dicarboxylate symporter
LIPCATNVDKCYDTLTVNDEFLFQAPASTTSLWGRWRSWPLYLRIIGALIFGVIVGVVAGESAGWLSTPAKLILRLLGALAPPLILVAVIRALLRVELKGTIGLRIAGLLLLNTLVAIMIGLVVANVIEPGGHTKLTPPESHATNKAGLDPIQQLFDNVPKSLFGPLSDDGKVIGVIFIAVAFGIALRRFRETPIRNILDLSDIAFGAIITVLRWIIEVIPIAVFGIVASIVGTKGFADFKAVGLFVVAVIVALLLHATYYLLRVRFGSWVKPRDLLRGARDAMVMAFSTASSTATSPVTYACLRDRVGLREQSASLGALVASNFNNDGTALYEAMAALFVAQMLGLELTYTQQFLVVITSVFASVGAAGIPEAGLVTMTMVFKAVGLPVEYIAILLTVDWFLDRCRTVVNMMGDMNVACLLDGKTREQKPSLTL